jgi:hypothetical protein
MMILRERQRKIICHVIVLAERVFFNKAVPCAFAMSTTASFFDNKTERKGGKGKYE